MSRTIVTAALLTALATPAPGAVQTKAISYKDGDVELEGYLAWDDAATGKRPGVLVVPEWWGLDDYAKGRAEQLAKMGYVAFAADMYGKGKLTDQPSQAREWATALRSNTEVWRKRATAGFDVLANQESVDSGKLAAIGYCFGGSTCLQLAYAGKPLKAVGTFHAALPPLKEDEARQIKPRILVCHGAADTFISDDSIKSFRAALDGAKVDYKFIAYPGVKHSFTVPTADKRGLEGMKYDKAADESSWKELQELLKQAFGQT